MINPMSKRVIVLLFSIMLLVSAPMWGKVDPEIFKALKLFFRGKKKFEKLTELLEHYYNTNMGQRFIKKKFIAFTKMYNFSPAITNTFFAYCQRALVQSKEIQELFKP